MLLTKNLSLLKVKEQIVLREEFDDWAILYNPDTGRAAGLSPTGVTVWKCLASEHSYDLEEIIKIIIQEYENLPADVANEVTEFIDSIVNYGYTVEGIK